MVATEFNIFTISTSASALIGVPIGSVPIKVFMVSFLFILYHGDWHGIAVGGCVPTCFRYFNNNVFIITLGDDTNRAIIFGLSHHFSFV